MKTSEIEPGKNYSNGPDRRYVCGFHSTINLDTLEIERDDILYAPYVNGKLCWDLVQVSRSEFASWAREEVK